MLYYPLMKRIPLIISLVLLFCFYANAQSKADGGATNDGTYTNPDFGFSFKYPKDWSVHGEATNERIREIGKIKATESGASEPSLDVALKNTYQLLTVFRYPIGTPGVTFNPGILVMAEKVAHAPGITNGKDYLLNVRAVALKYGSQPLLKEPTEYHFGGSQFFRDDFDVVVGNGVHVFQSSFATLVDRYALVFIFMNKDQTSVDEMSKAMETFVRTPKGVTTQHKPN